MRLLLAAGARPQFIKAAALLPALRRRHEVFFVHTGQHDDPRMVEAHFAGLGLPAPDARLESRAEGAARLARMIEGLAPLCRRTDRVLALGDTDSAHATALAAAFSGVPVAHVEAGARSGDRSMPEERNRILVDELSDRLFCSTAAHAGNLGGRGGVEVVGDVMADLLLAREREIRSRPRPIAEEYALLTLHRAATADDPEAVARVLAAVASSPFPALFPIHPRTARSMPKPPGRIRVTEPLPYLEFLAAVAHARLVLTDSGGLQKEACLLGVPCVTLRETTEWRETVEAGWNRLAGTDPARILEAMRAPRPTGPPPRLYGEGRAAERIAAAL
jgi:UDP-N-acetylglucosamine 2-epimerase